MNPIANKKDREAFLKSLALWDRPDSEFFGTPLESDVDTDGLVDKLFSTPSGGLLKD